MRSIFTISILIKTLSVMSCLCIATQLTAQEPPEILGISHIAVKVSDIEKSIPFYSDFLGFAEQYRMNNPKDGSLKLICYKVNDEQFIEVFTGLKPDENRIYQIAYRVADAEKTRAYLAGKDIKTPASVPKGTAKNLNFTVKDPAGYTIELVEYTPDGWTMRDKGKFLPDSRVSDHITHAGVVVADLPAVKHFYGDILGFKEGWRGSANGEVISWIHMKLPGGDYVELMLNPKTVPHFCLEVPDINKAKAKLEASPYRPKYEKPFEPYIGKSGKRIINLYDPDGTRIELMEPNTADGKPVPPSDAPLPKT
jgi:catechol 2,3-dioxygenase-like lactoylglutathione lyase family enzyme